MSGHFQDIGHDPTVHDVTYENAQARERTQILMDLANQNGGLVIGTGDLSELALGWATYNGDHMSMYAVNASVPKTLVRHLVHYAAQQSGGALCEVLEDILDTPVSPELLPPVDGVISQKTESLVGPYELHDFFLYHMLRFGFPPSKIYRMALRTFSGTYDAATIYKWLYTFYRRFFAQQFKRSCLPDGPRSARSRSLLAATGGCPATPAHAYGWKSWKPFPLNRKIFVGGACMKKVRITVLKTTLDEELSREYGVEGLDRMPHDEGRASVLCGPRKAGRVLRRGLESDLSVCVRPGPRRRNGLFYYGDWIRKPGVAICSCNDGLRPVIFKLKRPTKRPPSTIRRCGNGKAPSWISLGRIPILPGCQAGCAP